MSKILEDFFQPNKIYRARHTLTYAWEHYDLTITNNEIFYVTNLIKIRNYYLCSCITTTTIGEWRIHKKSPLAREPNYYVEELG